MHSLRAVWFVIFLLMMPPLAFGQSLIGVRRHQRSPDAESGTKPGRFAGSARRVTPPSPRVDREPGRSTLERPEDPCDVGEGTRDPKSAAPPPVARVYLVRHVVNVTITDGIAITEIDQTFHNEGKWQMEGTYVCPLPDQAVLNGFSIFMAGREVRGSVMDRTRARDIYRRIVGKSRDPGIVELIESGKGIRTRIFPIPANGNMRVKTRYAHLLAGGPAGTDTTIPLRSASRVTGPPIAHVSLNVEARSSWPVRLQTDKGVSMDISGLGDGRKWTAKFSAKKYRPDKDACLRIRPRDGGEKFAVRQFRDERGERTFVAVIEAGDRSVRKARLELDGAEIAEVFPASIPKVEPGHRCLVFGRIRGSKPATAVLAYRIGSKPHELRVPFTKSATRTEPGEHIPAFFALEKVRALLASKVPEPDMKKQVVELGTKYGILTKYTAFLAR